MRIDSNLCIACGECVHYCPSDAISLHDIASIDQDLCTECGTCLRVGVCPVDAFEKTPMQGLPREIRAFFSDPAATHALTRVPGRGTEEVKTNDVTGRVKRGELGIAVEVGRPCLGTTLVEVERVTTALAPLGIRYERNNPMTHLLESETTGKIKDELRHERVTSLIIEFTASHDRLDEILRTLRKVAAEIDTVFALDVMSCFDDDGSLPVRDRLAALGLTPRPNAKVNLGLGRPLASGSDPGGGAA